MAKNALRQKRETNNWTVTVYMAADNSLAEESVWALTEILEIDPQLGSDLRVEVLFDSSAKGVPTRVYSLPITTGPGTTSAADSGLDKAVPSNLSITTAPGAAGAVCVRRIDCLRILGRDFVSSPARHKTAGLLPSRSNSRGGKSENASEIGVLKRYLTKTMRKHVNDHQLLVLSGHGSGAIGDFLSGSRAQEAITIIGLGDTLRKVKDNLKKRNPEFNFDIIGMDSCLMSMAEVAYELRDCANILIGSEGFEPETGWPYKNIIPKVKNAADLPLLAGEIVNEYIGYYANYAVAGTSVDLSACDLNRADDLRASLEKLSRILLGKFLERDQKVIDAVLLAHWRAQSYKNEQYVDLWDFCDLLKNGCEDKNVKSACQEVCDVIDGEGGCKTKGPLVISSKYYGPAFQHSHGVSLYFPWRESPALDEYQNLSLAEDTRWGEFLKTYVNVTQRGVRGQSGPKVEEINIIPVERPLIIPLQVDATVGVRSPPDTGRAMLLGRDAMKNPPTSFRINTVTGESIKEGVPSSKAAAAGQYQTDQ